MFTDPETILLILIFIIFIIPFITKKLRIPSILGLLVAGIIIGPLYLNLIPITPGTSIDLLQNIGILYNMFIAGLEIDIDQFNRLKNKSILFGLLTTLFPGLLALIFTEIIFPQLGFLHALLVADIVFSHSSIAYALVSGIGVANDDSVIITVGATLITDTLAFLLLAVLVGIHTSADNFSILSFGIILINIMIFVIFSLILLPKIVRPLFRIKKSTTTDFVLTFAVLLVMALFAENIGLAAIIGAFMAGLAINRAVPKDSQLLQITVFVGRAFFIPIFFIYIGTLVNIGAFFSGNVIVVYSYSFIFLCSLFVGKFLAAWISARLYKFNFAQFMTSYSFTLPQVGGTLATLFVGIQYGMLSGTAINAGFVFVIVTVFIGPLLTNIYAPKLLSTSSSDMSSKNQDLLKKVLLPFTTIDNSFSEVLGLAGTIVQNSNGILYPLTIVPHLGDTLHIQTLPVTDTQLLTTKVHEVLGIATNEISSSIQVIQRIATTIPDGIIFSTAELKPTLVLLQWKGYSSNPDQFFSQVIDTTLKRSTFPVGLIKVVEPVQQTQRFVLFLTDTDFNSHFTNDFISTAKTLAKSYEKTLIVLDISHQDDTTIQKQLLKIKPECNFEYRKIIVPSARKLQNELQPHDFVLTSFPSTHMVFSALFSTNTILQSVQSTHFYMLLKTPHSLLTLHFPLNNTGIT